MYSSSPVSSLALVWVLLAITWPLRAYESLKTQIHAWYPHTSHRDTQTGHLQVPDFIDPEDLDDYELRMIWLELLDEDPLIQSSCAEHLDRCLDLQDAEGHSKTNWKNS